MLYMPKLRDNRLVSNFKIKTKSESYIDKEV